MRQQIIVALSGRKGSGKNTIAQFIQEYYVSAVLGLSRNSGAVGGFDYYVEESCFECSFADNLKEFCINTLGLTHEQCYGSDDEKNTTTRYKWEDAPKVLRWKFGGSDMAEHMVANGSTQDQIAAMYYDCGVCRNNGIPGPDVQALATGYMTGREIMQIVGTDLCRQTFGNIWAEATVRTIKRHKKPMNVITDNRFPNEIAAVLAEPGGFIIRLTRSPFGTVDVHPSESALDGYEWNKERCYVLENSNMTIEEQNEAIVPILDEIFELMEDN